MSVVVVVVVGCGLSSLSAAMSVGGGGGGEMLRGCDDTRHSQTPMMTKLMCGMAFFFFPVQIPTQPSFNKNWIYLMVIDDISIVRPIYSSNWLQEDFIVYN